jgi:hypothetical protein
VFRTYQKLPLEYLLVEIIPKITKHVEYFNHAITGKWMFPQMGVPQNGWFVEIPLNG